MKLQDKKIKIHKLGNELFGRETTLLDLLAIFVGSFSLAIVTLLTTWGLDLSFTGAILLLIGILMNQQLTFSNQLLQLFLLLYSIKLILAFSIDWTSHNK